MSDSSAMADIWADVLARTLPHSSPLTSRTFRDRASKYTVAFLCGFTWLAITTQPLNLQRFRGEPDTTRQVERQNLDAVRRRVGAALQPVGQPREKLQNARSEFDEDDDGNWLFRMMGPAVSKIVGVLSSSRVTSLIESIDAGLCFGLIAVAVPWALRKIFLFAQRTPVGQATPVTSRETPAERRREPRVRTRYRHGVLYEGYKLVCDCVVFDRSPRGARIRTSRPLPPFQMLRFLDLHERVLYEGRVAWQNDTEAGLELTRLFRVRSVPTRA